MTDPNPFDGCESLDEIIAIVYSQLGADGLNQLLKTSAGILCQQGLQEAAEQFNAAGLIEPAELLATAAVETPKAKRWRSREQHRVQIETGRSYWGGSE